MHTTSSCQIWWWGSWGVQQYLANPMNNPDEWWQLLDKKFRWQNYQWLKEHLVFRCCTNDENLSCLMEEKWFVGKEIVVWCSLNLFRSFFLAEWHDIVIVIWHVPFWKLRCMVQLTPLLRACLVSWELPKPWKMKIEIHGS